MKKNQIKYVGLCALSLSASAFVANAQNQIGQDGKRADIRFNGRIGGGLNFARFTMNESELDLASKALLNAQVADLQGAHTAADQADLVLSAESIRYDQLKINEQTIEAIAAFTGSVTSEEIHQAKIKFSTGNFDSEDVAVTMDAAAGAEDTTGETPQVNFMELVESYYNAIQNADSILAEINTDKIYKIATSGAEDNLVKILSTEATVTHAINQMFLSNLKLEEGETAVTIDTASVTEFLADSGMFVDSDAQVNEGGELELKLGEYTFTKASITARDLTDEALTQLNLDINSTKDGVDVKQQLSLVELDGQEGAVVSANAFNDVVESQKPNSFYDTATGGQERTRLFSFVDDNGDIMVGKLSSGMDWFNDANVQATNQQVKMSSFVKIPNGHLAKDYFEAANGSIFDESNGYETYYGKDSNGQTVVVASNDNGKTFFAVDGFFVDNMYGTSVMTSTNATYNVTSDFVSSTESTVKFENPATGEDGFTYAHYGISSILHASSDLETKAPGLRIENAIDVSVNDQHKVEEFSGQEGAKMTESLLKIDATMTYEALIAEVNMWETEVFADPYLTESGASKESKVFFGKSKYRAEGSGDYPLNGKGEDGEQKGNEIVVKEIVTNADDTTTIVNYSEKIAQALEGQDLSNLTVEQILALDSGSNSELAGIQEDLKAVIAANDDLLAVQAHINNVNEVFNPTAEVRSPTVGFANDMAVALEDDTVLMEEIGFIDETGQVTVPSDIIDIALADSFDAIEAIAEQDIINGAQAFYSEQAASFASADADQETIDQTFLNHKGNLDASVGMSVYFGKGYHGYSDFRLGTSIMLGQDDTFGTAFHGATFDANGRLGGSIDVKNGIMNFFAISGITSLHGSRVAFGDNIYSDDSTTSIVGLELGAGMNYIPDQSRPVGVYAEVTVPMFFGNMSVADSSGSMTGVGQHLVMPKFSAGIQIGL